MSQNPQGCFGFLFRLFGGQKAEISTSSPAFSYRLQNHFLSKGELAFYESLKLAVGDQGIICPKVRLADIFYVPNNNYAQRNRIAQKHVDFLICDPVRLQPLVGVELDDKSHQRPERQERDQFVDEVFRVANFPLVHIPAQSSYLVDALCDQLEGYLSAVPAIPTCPRCGVPMVIRTAKSGANAGNKFYGCSNYPTCREMRPV